MHLEQELQNQAKISGLADGGGKITAKKNVACIAPILPIAIGTPKGEAINAQPQLLRVADMI